MKHGRRFHFEFRKHLENFKFVLRFKLEESSRFLRGFSSTFKLKIMIFEVYDT